MRKLNFRYKIFIYFTIAAILPSLFFWQFLYEKIDQKLVNDYKKTSYDYVLSQITKIDQFLLKQQDIVESAAHAYEYIDKSPESVGAFLKGQIKLNNSFKDMYIIKADGELIKSNGTVAKDQDYTKLRAYSTVYRRSQIIWFEPYKDEISGIYTIGVAAPLQNEDGETEGVLVTNLNYEYFKRTIREIGYLTGSEIFLIDSVGNIKYSESDKFKGYKNIRDEGFVMNNSSESAIYMAKGKYDIEYNGSMWLCTFLTPRTEFLKIVALTDASSLIENANVINSDIYGPITVFGIIMILVVAVLSFVLSKSISGPLLVLRDGVKELSVGNLEHIITIDSKDEISEVAEAFNQMSYNLKQSYQDLFSRTEELYEKNESLQEMNTELEASYEQLGATMEQLNESEEKYRSLVNNISDMVVALNDKGEITYINTAAQNILGQSESQLIGRSIRDVLRGELNEETLSACYENDYYEVQLRLAGFTKKVLYFEGSTRRIIEDGNVIGIQGIVRDITQRKIMEDELRTRYKEMKALNEITSAVTKTLDLDELLDIVVDQIMNTTGAICSAIGLFEGDNQYKLKAAKGVRLKDKELLNVELTKSDVLKTIENKRYQLIELTEEKNLPNEYFKILYRDETSRYILLTPLISHGSLIGVMSNIYRTKPGNELAELLVSIASSVALNIDNAKAYESVKSSYLKTVQSLVSAIEAKDIYTESHSMRVAKYASFIAWEMKLDRNIVEDIWVAGVLHDIGKIGISDSILNKKDKLTDEEYCLVKQHPEIAYKILSNIGLDQNIMYAVKHHHERYDGKGYPDGISGDEINLMASIISVVDAFDAITSERSYRAPRTVEEGMAELRACKGTQFNPQLVEIFERAFMTKPDIFYKIFNNEDIKLF